MLWNVINEKLEDGCGRYQRRHGINGGSDGAGQIEPEGDCFVRDAIDIPDSGR